MKWAQDFALNWLLRGQAWVSLIFIFNKCKQHNKQTAQNRIRVAKNETVLASKGLCNQYFADSRVLWLVPEILSLSMSNRLDACGHNG